MLYYTRLTGVYFKRWHAMTATIACTVMSAAQSPPHRTTTSLRVLALEMTGPTEHASRTQMAEGGACFGRNADTQTRLVSDGRGCCTYRE